MMITVKTNKKRDGNMEKLNILLVYSSGTSSGFTATSVGKAAAARGLNVDIRVRSENEIENYIEGIDVLVMRPHLVYVLDKVEECIDGLGMKVILMSPGYYPTLNGDKAIDRLLSEME